MLSRFPEGSSADAIRQLVQEGLVDYEPHRGAFVRITPFLRGDFIGAVRPTAGMAPPATTATTPAATTTTAVPTTTAAPGA